VKNGEKAAVPEYARRLSVLLDSAIRIPGTDIRVGLDPIIGAVLPELGDALTGVLSLTLLAVAYKERVPSLVILRMLLNIGVDALLGAIPLVGDVFDFAFKSNEKNLDLIERHRRDPSHPVTWSDRLVVYGAFVLALCLAVFPIVVGTVLVRFVVTHWK